jgi:hypothetical protein
VLWKRALGEGYSSILVESGVLYTMYGRPGEEVTLAAKAATGQTIWERANPVRFHNVSSMWTRRLADGKATCLRRRGDSRQSTKTTFG